jgi:hypothetical protein
MTNYEFLKELSSICSIVSEYVMDDGHIMLRVYDSDGWNSIIVEFDVDGNVIRVY